MNGRDKGESGRTCHTAVSLMWEMAARNNNNTYLTSYIFKQYIMQYVQKK
jgi:hypothetical protein